MAAIRYHVLLTVVLACCFRLAVCRDTLVVGDLLTEGQSLTSKNDKYFVSMQRDGNVVVYRRGSGLNNHAIWASKTEKACCGKFFLTMQIDNNLVAYSTAKKDAVAVWASGSTCRTAPAKAVMQDDGNFVVYAKDGTPIWASGTQGGVKSAHSGKGQNLCSK